MRVSFSGGKTRVVLSIAVILSLLGCGDRGIAEEMEQVPGLAFLHVHVEKGFDRTLLPEGLGDMIPVWLCDSLLARGPLGVSLLGINLTDLSPQLQFLTGNMDEHELADIATVGFECSQAEKNGYIDLVSPGGSLVASVAGRDGWSCVIVGSGADAAVQRWLELSPEGSLAADSGLVGISRSTGQLSVLVSQNTISFLMFIPDGMLSRAEKAIMQTVRTAIDTVGPSALRLSLSSSGTGPYSIRLEIELLRSGGERSTLTLDLSDTAISPDSLAGVISAILGAGAGR